MNKIKLLLEQHGQKRKMKVSGFWRYIERLTSPTLARHLNISKTRQQTYCEVLKSNPVSIEWVITQPVVMDCLRWHSWSKLISQFAQIECQGHSPDFNPLGIIFGGHIDTLAFKQHPKWIEKLKLIIQELTNNQDSNLNKRPAITCQSAQWVVENEGGHFEHLKILFVFVTWILFS